LSFNWAEVSFPPAAPMPGPTGIYRYNFTVTRVSDDVVLGSSNLAQSTDPAESWTETIDLAEGESYTVTIRADYQYQVSLVAGPAWILGTNPTESDGFMVDTQPPTASITALSSVQTASPFAVAWTGSDAASGIDSYEVQYRETGGAWVTWQSGTSDTTAFFSRPKRRRLRVPRPGHGRCGARQ
jgi:hypothetical protein